MSTENSSIFMRLIDRLKSLFTRRIVLSPMAVRPGDDLILAPTDWPASQDMVGFLNAAQQQFPGVRIHLLVGFGAVQVQRNQRGAESEKPGKESQPQRTLTELAQQSRVAAAKTGQQGNVVVLTWCAEGRVVAVSIPPEQQGNFVEKTA